MTNDEVIGLTNAIFKMRRLMKISGKDISTYDESEGMNDSYESDYGEDEDEEEEEYDDVSEAK